jgi:hypothetical protein
MQYPIKVYTKFKVRCKGTAYIPNRYAPCLSSVFQFEFRDEKQKEFSQRTLY